MKNDFKQYQSPTDLEWKKYGKNGHSGVITYWNLYQGKVGEKLFVSVFPIPSGYGNLRPLYIRFVERKLILEYALKWGISPEINKK